MKVTFRVDASVSMGTGHLMRCLTLAHELQQRGVETRFICGNQIGNLNDWLQSKGITVMVIPNATNIDVVKDAEQSISALNGDGSGWLVVDHYGLDIVWEQRLRPFVGRILVIDDHTDHLHDCDVLLDQNYVGENGCSYAGLVPDQCRMLLGPGFALLRKEFIEFRQNAKCREILKNILVFFTGGDDQGETLKAMRGIEIFGAVQSVDVVVGRSNPNNDAIKKKCAELDWGYHCQVDYMAKLIAKSDLVIGAGGSSNWERCVLGAPALVAILADNQITIAQSLDSAGVVLNLGWAHALKPDDYVQALQSIGKNRLFEMSSKALNMMDGAGAARVADALLYS